jgi:hypothetical protein
MELQTNQIEIPDLMEALSYRAKIVRKYGGRIPKTNEGIQTGFYRPDLLPQSAEVQVSSTNIAIPKLRVDEGNCASSSSAGTKPAEGLDPAGLPGLVCESGQTASAKNDLVSPISPKGTLAEDESLAKALRAAFVELYFDHGYPAQPNGSPFWHKLEFESGLAFATFQIFLESGEEGPRELYKLAENSEVLQVVSAQMGRKVNKTELLLHVQEYYILHCWQGRVRAYDLYKNAALRHQRLLRQGKMEDNHYQVAARILKKLEEYFLEDRFMDEMTPKTALDALSKVVAIQRVSVGLPAAGPLSMQQQPTATSFEMIMRNVAQQQGVTHDNMGGSSSSAHTKQLIDDVLQDAGAAANLQEVIIRISQVSSGAEPTPEKRFPGRQMKNVDVEDATVIEAELRDLGTGITVGGAEGG